MDAVDARAMRVDAYGQAVWSRPPDAGDKPAQTIAPATEANKPGTPGRARSSRKTIAQGVPCDFGVPVLSLRAFPSFCTQGSGCGVHPAFPAPSIFGRDTDQASSGRFSAAGMRDRAQWSWPSFETRPIGRSSG